MEVNIVAVGKIKEKFFADAISEYQKRLSAFCKFSIIEVPELSSQKNILKKTEEEGKLILQKCSGVLVCTEISGEAFSSEDLAEFIADKQTSGLSKITFVIGGSNGLSKEVLSKADLKLSFGKITFPHQLFRVVLVEQIYRAFSIICKMPYHK